MTLALFWTFYKYREPIYCNERLQLNFLSDDDVDDFLYGQFEKMMDQLGIVDCFQRPFTIPAKHPDYVLIKKVFDRLVAAGELEVLQLNIYLMRSYSKSLLPFKPK